MKTTKVDRGSVLISEPNIIGDATFSRSLVYLSEYDANGVVGFIINKPSEYTLDELIPDIEIEVPVFKGGPVDTDNLYFLHAVPDLIPESHLINDTIHWGGDFNVAIELLKSRKINPAQIKFFLGYSGWELTQLDEELKGSSWVISDQLEQNAVLEVNTCHLWRDKMKTLGGAYEFWSNAPDNPTYN